MNHRDTQICLKILSEIAFLRTLLAQTTEQEFIRDERTFLHDAD